MPASVQGARTIASADEPRPGYSTQRLGSSSASTCGDCNGTGRTSDYDGSLTGSRGAMVTCTCTGGAW
ncbi:hypothetical protein [Streptomyces sp. NPDC055210]